MRGVSPCIVTHKLPLTFYNHLIPTRVQVAPTDLTKRECVGRMNYMIGLKRLLINLVVLIEQHQMVYWGLWASLNWLSTMSRAICRFKSAWSLKLKRKGDSLGELWRKIKMEIQNTPSLPPRYHSRLFAIQNQMLRNLKLIRRAGKLRYSLKKTSKLLRD